MHFKRFFDGLVQLQGIGMAILFFVGRGYNAFVMLTLIGIKNLL